MALLGFVLKPLCVQEQPRSTNQIAYKGGGGGGGGTKWKTLSPNFEKLIESITNMLFFFQGGLGKKSYKVWSKVSKLIFEKNSSLF